MSMKKKRATAMPTATIVRRTITKKTISKEIITGNKGMEGPTVMETEENMQET
jgi:hypothetical protein